MKGYARLLMVLAASYPLAITAQGIADITSRLESTGCYRTEVSYNVTLPQSENDVIYTVSLASAPAPADPLAPCSYLTEWSMDTPSGTAKGFSAYFNGHHYRYHNERLQEYHLDWDSIPFLSTPRSAGVQASAQFADLYPAAIAREFREMAANPQRYSITIDPDCRFNGLKAVKVATVMTADGITVQEKDFILDTETMLPLRIETESNSGQITEQSILANYSYQDGNPSSTAPCPELNDTTLMARYPEIFEKYRETNFHIENLAGAPMPTFSLPTTTGERYTHHRGERFAVPTVIVIMDPAAGFNTRIVSEVRSAVDALPKATDVIWVFNTTNIDAIDAIVPSVRPGEHLLMNGKALARDCGAASLPVIIMTSTDGNVKKVSLGFNRKLGEIVLQTMALTD